jgi:gliding motility-associated-like protein
MKRSLLLILWVFCTLASVKAQLCSGSLGDPVVSISFGTGSFPGPPLTGSTTTYQHTTSTCPNDGQYSVVSATAACFGTSWHTLSQDHTPNDVDGHFMLVNASFQPSDFYLDTIRGLCPNTNYEFAAWITNVLLLSACNSAGIRPNLTFRIETITGTVLSTYNTGDINSDLSPSWKQYGLFFQTPVGTADVVIRLTNNAPGGCGNDLALDDITFRPCGPKVNATVNITGTAELFACENERKDFLLTATYSDGVYVNPSFQWQESTDNGVTWIDIPGATNNNYLRPASAIGTFLYRMLIADGPVNITAVACRLASNTVTVEVVQPVAEADSLVIGCEGTNISFTANGGSTYSWTGPNGFVANVQSPTVMNARLSDAGWYRVVATDMHGCTDDDSTSLNINPKPIAVISPAVGVCEGSSVGISVSGGIRYLWSPPNDLSSDTIPNPIASPADTTLYTAYVFNEYGCLDTASVYVNIWKKPTADAGPDKKITQGYPATITGTITGSDINYYWTPNSNIADPRSLKTTVSPPSSIYYTLHAESRKGCGTDLDEVFIRVYEKILIPNAFSPNGDGINDTWVIEPLDYFSESVTSIFNRYGQLVFTSKGYPKPWDGTIKGSPLPVGVYYYVIDLKTNKEPLLSGSVLIIR